MKVQNLALAAVSAVSCGPAGAPADPEAVPLASERAAAPCGTPLAELDGVIAYSNGEFQRTGEPCAGLGRNGLRYLGRELVQRYMATVFGGPPGSWGLPSLSLCDQVPAGFTVHRGPIGYGAVRGDAVVLPLLLPTGHAAIVQAVTSDELFVVEQNGDPSGLGRYQRARVTCYIHANANDSLPG